MKIKSAIILISVLILYLSYKIGEYYVIIGPAMISKSMDSNPKPIFDGENEPKMPNLTENSKTLLGIDMNKNGIRDDVDIWINRTGFDYNERMAMRQYAKSLQEELNVCNKKQRDDASRVVTNIIIADSCLTAVSDFRRSENFAKTNLNVLSFNNNLRKECISYIYSSSFTYGGKGAPMGAPHLDCHFNIANLEEVIKKYKTFWGYDK